MTAQEASESAAQSSGDETAEALAEMKRIHERMVADAAATEAEPAVPAVAVLPRTVWAKIVLRDGRELERARANAQDAATVTFLHAGGISKVDKRLLPEELAAVFPFDASAAAEEATEKRRAAQVAAATNRIRMEEAARSEALREEKRATAGKVAAARAETQAASTDAAVRLATTRRARTYFENEKRTGSGATLVFGVECDLDDPVELTGWTDRWEIAGTATYKVYDSIGWGSFSTRKKKFRAFVEAPPGKTAKVVDFEER